MDREFVGLLKLTVYVLLGMFFDVPPLSVCFLGEYFGCGGKELG